MTILVFGASGQIGRFLLPRLLASGESVMAISRQPQPPQADVSWLVGNLPDPVPALPLSLSAIICLGPLNWFADWLMRVELGGSPRIIALSSMSAETKRESNVASERELSRLLDESESLLATACLRHGCGWTVLRPTLVYGAGMDKSLTPIARRASRLRLFPIPAAKGLRQPVHADDIAQAVMAALDCPAASGRILPIGGGERLSVQHMFARVRRSLPIATLPLPLPSWLLQLSRHVMPSWRGPLHRLEADLVADNAELQRLLGVHPRPFQPDASTWTALD
jgi:nucleoside-diphosphate-sugar epimerase